MIYLGNSPVGVAVKGVGEFTKYEQHKVTPSETSNLTVSHNLGVLPKLVMFNSTQTYGSISYINDGVLNQKCGNARTMASADTFSVNGFTVLTGTTGSSNSYAYFTNDSVVIRRATSAKYFDTNTEYTVDIYA